MNGQLTPDELLEAVHAEKDESTLLSLIRKGGKRATDEQGDERVKICAGCKYAGMVTPLPGKTFHGCTKCGCPFASKAYMLNLLTEKTTCPHPSGNLWAEIDSKFKK